MSDGWRDNPWHHERSIEKPEYFVDRNIQLERWVAQIRDIRGPNSRSLLIHLIGAKGSGKSSAMTVLEGAAAGHLITQRYSVGTDYWTLGYVPPRQRDAQSCLNEWRRDLVLAREIVDALWEEKYDRQRAPLTKLWHKAKTRLSRRGGQLPVSLAPPVGPGIGADIGVPPEDPTRAARMLLAEVKRMVGRATRKACQGVAIMLDDADDMVGSPLLEGIGNNLSAARLACVVVIATTDTFLRVLKQKARDVGYDELSESEADGIDALEGKFATVEVRPYDVGDNQQRRDVMDNAIKKVLEDYNRVNQTNYRFHRPSAEIIALRSAGQLFLVSLLCECCFEKCRTQSDVIFLGEAALSSAVSGHGRDAYRRRIVEENVEAGGDQIWADARRIEVQVNEGGELTCL